MSGALKDSEIRAMDAALVAGLNRLIRDSDADGLTYYADFMDSLTDEVRAEVEAACERHAARMRRRGEIGW